MDLNQVRKAGTGRKYKFRKGRGQGSGLGKQSGKGHKGQKARSGVSFRPYFEGGQMPNIRRVPKRGFNNKDFKTVYAVVNVKDLSEWFQDGATVDLPTLQTLRRVKGRVDGLKILGEGALSKKLTVKAHKFSKTAEKKIADAGGVVEKIS